MTLNEIADAVERLEGPDRWTDGRIAMALEPDADWREFADTWGKCDPEDHGAFIMPPQYTASLDAAMMLVPEGMSVHLSRCPGAGAAEIYSHAKRGVSTGTVAAATPVLALVAASLRARAAGDRP